MCVVVCTAAAAAADTKPARNSITNDRACRTTDRSLYLPKNQVSIYPRFYHVALKVLMLVFCEDRVVFQELGTVFVVELAEDNSFVVSCQLLWWLCYRRDEKNVIVEKVMCAAAEFYCVKDFR